MALTLVVKDVLANFAVISNVDHHQTLIVQGDRLAFENRPCQWIWRWVTGDSRHQVIATIHKTMEVAEQLIQNYKSSMFMWPDQHCHADQLNPMLDNLKDLRDCHEPVIRGLDLLASYERYKRDSCFQMEVQQFKKQIGRIHKRSHLLLQQVRTQLKPGAAGLQACCAHADHPTFWDEEEEVQPMPAADLP